MKLVRAAEKEAKKKKGGTAVDTTQSPELELLMFSIRD